MHADRTPVFPHEHIPLNVAAAAPWMHAVELAACCARGQRGLIIGPPGSGKSTILREMAHAFTSLEAPRSTVIAVLVDQRSEERLEWHYDHPQVKVVATTSEDPPQAHAALGHIFVEAAEAAQRGSHVVLLVDSLTALAQAINITQPDSDRILTGGVLATALQVTRQHFGQARVYDDGGSLTIMATAVVDSERESDLLITQDLVGTGNMEIRIDPASWQSGISPALDFLRSGTRKSESIVGIKEDARRAVLRAKLVDQGNATGMALLLEELDRFGSLNALLDAIT